MSISTIEDIEDHPSVDNAIILSSKDTITDSTYWVEELGLKDSDKQEIIEGAWLNDRHINAGQKCLKRQFVEQAGLQDTLVLKELAVYKSSKENFIQILNVNASHWVCISNKGLPPGIVVVFDSMPSYTKDSTCLQKQVSVILHTMQKFFVIQHVDVQRQNGASDCGLFALAFAVALCNGQYPHEYKYNQDRMRHHLIECLEKQCMTPFPSTPRRMSQQRIVYQQTISVYCTCRMPWDRKDSTKGSLVCCGNCHEWYHQACRSQFQHF